MAKRESREQLLSRSLNDFQELTVAAKRYLQRQGIDTVRAVVESEKGSKILNDATPTNVVKSILNWMATYGLHFANEKLPPKALRFVRLAPSIQDYLNEPLDDAYDGDVPEALTHAGIRTRGDYLAASEGGVLHKLSVSTADNKLELAAELHEAIKDGDIDPIRREPFVLMDGIWHQAVTADKLEPVEEEG